MLSRSAIEGAPRASTPKQSMGAFVGVPLSRLTSGGVAPVGAALCGSRQSNELSTRRSLPRHPTVRPVGALARCSPFVFQAKVAAVSMGASPTVPSSSAGPVDAYIAERPSAELATFWEQTRSALALIDELLSEVDDLLVNEHQERAFSLAQDDDVDTVELALASAVVAVGRDISQLSTPPLVLSSTRLLDDWGRALRLERSKSLVACADASVAGRCCEPGSLRQERLRKAGAMMKALSKVLTRHELALSASTAEMMSHFTKLYPVACMLLQEGALLPTGQHRAPGSVLDPLPFRNADLLIPRDDEVVETVEHLWLMRGTRTASFMTSSPGQGKTHFIWDLLDALPELDTDKYHAVAQRAKVLSWTAVVDAFKDCGVCVLSFNGRAAWSSSDNDLIEKTVKSEPRAVYLPLYLRVLWFMRCADKMMWPQFSANVLRLLASKATTVQAIIDEAMQALCERSTIIIVEELNKIEGLVISNMLSSPAEKVLTTDAGLPRPQSMSPDPSFPVTSTSSGDGDGGEEPARETLLRQTSLTQTRMDVYRHEICLWTNLMGSSSSLLFTSPSFAVVYNETQYAQGARDLKAVNLPLLVKELLAARDHAKTRQILQSSADSRRLGSPFLLTCASELGFLDMDKLASVYFLPLFKTNKHIRASFSDDGSHLMRSDRAARAFGRLSGGHARSAAYLLQRLSTVKSGPVWPKVVETAGRQLAQSSDMQLLLTKLFYTPVVIVAAIQRCTIQSQLPLSGSLSPDNWQSWDELFQSNVLTCSVEDSDGTYGDPSIPPLFLIALLKFWVTMKRTLQTDLKNGLGFWQLAGVLDALSMVFDVCDKKGDSGEVWEYVTLYADVALTRVRAAALVWGLTSPGLKLSRDYRSATLAELYPGTQYYYKNGQGRVLKETRFCAVAAVNANVDEANNKLEDILQLNAAALTSTVFKCKPLQKSFDHIKFLPLSGSTEVRKEDLFAICKSSKFTGRGKAPTVNVATMVRKSLKLLSTAFGDEWNQWKNRTVLVVETNLKAADNPDVLLDDVESAMVIIVTLDEHLDMYGRALSGFIADGPALYGATIE